MAEQDWTFMVFMAGDNDLSAAGDADLTEMRSVGSSDSVAVVAEFDSAGDAETRRIRIERGGEGEETLSLGETDSGSPDAVVSFVEWAVDRYPADRYGLVLWNHGSGWEPAEIDRIARSVNAADYTPRELGERAGSRLGRAFFRTTVERIMRLETAAERAICSDDGTGHSLDTLELADVLRAVTSAIGRRLDLLGFDACLMANLEVAYEVRPFVRYLVGSEENEPNQGWPYDRILRELTANAETPTPELASAIVRHYGQWYADMGHSGPITQVALDLDRLDELTDPLAAWARALADGLPDAAGSVWRAQRASARFWGNTLWDIKQFAEELRRFASTGEIAARAAEVTAALAVGEGLVLAETHRGETVAECGGLSIYLLPPITPISRFYGDLTFAREHAWHGFLRAYHAS